MTAGGYPPPYAGGTPYAPSGVGALPQEAYTPWIKRVLAALVDGLIPAVISLIGVGIASLIGWGTADCVTTNYSTDDSSPYDAGFSKSCEVTSVNAGAIIAVVVAGVLATVFTLWNLYRQGKTGSTIGKSALHFKVVAEKDGQPIGFLMSFVRQICHIVDQIICYIGYLFPLWDRKRQTIADKIVSTVCLPTDNAATGTR